MATESKEVKASLLSQKIVVALCWLFILGCLSMGLQLAWTRLMGIFLGSTIYAISSILAVYLAATALGSFLASKIISNSSFRLLCYLGGILFLLVLLQLYCLSWSADLALLLQKVFNPMLARVMVVALLIMPIILLSGAFFPLAIQCLPRKERSQSWWAGMGFAINTVGSVIGALFVALIFIPYLGTINTILFLVALFLLATLYLAHVNKIPYHVYVGAGFLCLLVFVWLTVPRQVLANLLNTAYLEHNPNFVDFERIVEGKNATISLHLDPDYQEQTVYRLRSNGLNESVFLPSEPSYVPKYEALLALAPLLFTQTKKPKVLNIGYGGGHTARLLQYLAVGSLEVVEIEPAMYQLAQMYGGHDKSVVRPPLELIFSDANRFLALQQQHYDWILSQPSHSWLPGSSNLFTVEFFQRVAEHLSKEGVFVQWLNLYSMDKESLQSILAAFSHVFPRVLLLTDQGDEQMILLGKKSGNWSLNFNRQKLLAVERIQQSLEDIDISTVAEMVSLALADEVNISQFIQDTPRLNSVFNGVAELRQAKNFMKDIEYQPLLFFEQHYRMPYSLLTTNSTVDLLTDAQEIADRLFRTEQYERLHQFVIWFQKAIRPSVESLNFLADLYYRLERYASAQEAWQQSFQSRKTVDALNGLLNIYLQQRKWQDFDRIIKSAKGATNRESLCYQSLAQLRRSNDVRRARSVLNKIGGLSLQKICGALGDQAQAELFLAQANYKAALPSLEKYYEQYPRSVWTIKNLAKLYRLVGQQSLATEFNDYERRIVEEEIVRLNDLQKNYRQRGWLKDAKILQNYIDELK